MFYGNTVKDTRQLFFDSWKKHLAHQPLEPLEQQIVAVILDHPEYHSLLEALPTDVEKRFFPESGQSNPFLHMGLHLVIRDQIATDRPQGINEAYQKLLKKHNCPLHVEHLMLENLAEMLWQAQQYNQMPNINNYLARCQGLS